MRPRPSVPCSQVMKGYKQDPQRGLLRPAHVKKLNGQIHAICAGDDRMRDSHGVKVGKEIKGSSPR